MKMTNGGAPLMKSQHVCVTERRQKKINKEDWEQNVSIWSQNNGFQAGALSSTFANMKFMWELIANVQFSIPYLNFIYLFFDYLYVILWKGVASAKLFFLAAWNWRKGYV